jgi:hypothetical protein
MVRNELTPKSNRSNHCSFKKPLTLRGCLRTFEKRHFQLFGDFLTICTKKFVRGPSRGKLMITQRHQSTELSDGIHALRGKNRWQPVSMRI